MVKNGFEISIFFGELYYFPRAGGTQAKAGARYVRTLRIGFFSFRSLSNGNKNNKNQNCLSKDRKFYLPKSF